jgi:hypothetical protein
MSRIKLTLIAALVLGSASAAFARPTHLTMPSPYSTSTTVSDEGQGRSTSVNAPGP